MKVVVLGAGGPAGVNWCRALWEAGHHVIAVDEEPTHLTWAEPFAGEVLDGLPAIADVIHACPDGLAFRLSFVRDSVPASTLLPSHDVVRTCQDKYVAGKKFAAEGLRSAPIRLGRELPDYLKMAEQEFGRPFWLRAIHGAGARGATLVDDLRTGYHWLRYWETRDTDWEWIAEEYLPGRDYAWTGIYKNGELITSFARERLEYIYPNLAPSGLTGTPTRARIVHEPAVNEMAEASVAAVDDGPNGIYAVDLREDALGTPRPTEINAGRGGTTTGLWALAGVNFADIHARLAVGETVEASQRDALPEGLELRRHIDCGHVFVNESVLA